MIGVVLCQHRKIGRMRWIFLLLLVNICVASSANQNFLRHTHRRLIDDEAACNASTKASPFAEYLSGLPTVGLRNCISSNIESVVTALSAEGAKCTLPMLIDLLSTSTPNPGMDALSELSSALLGNSDKLMKSTDIETILTSWSSNSTINKEFCSTMNKQILPCIGTLMPILISLLEKKATCCGDLAKFYEALKILSSAGQSLTNTLFDVINGFHQTMCTTLTTDSFCGQRVLSFLSTGVKKNDDTSLLAPLLFSAGIPLFALPDNSKEFCSALEKETFPSRISPSSTIIYAPLSCCALSLGYFIESIDSIVTQVTGNNFAEIFSLITGVQDQNQFQAPYPLLHKCNFKDQCSAPVVLLPTNPSAPRSTASADTNTKNRRPQDIRCESVNLCNKDNVCSTVCKEGTVKIAPWVQRALSYQRNLSHADAFCYNQLPGAHNAATNFARGYGNRDQLMNAVLDPTVSDSYVRTNNQFLTLTDQLNLGIRFLEVDVHYFGKTLRSGHCSRISLDLLDTISKVLVRELQGVTSIPIEWQSSLMGCIPSLSGIRAEEQRLQRDTLLEIANWVEHHPSDFLMVYSELGQEISKFKKIDDVMTMYKDILGKYVILPSQFNGNISISDLMEKTGKRVVLLSTGGTTEVDTLMIPMDKICSGWIDIPSGTLPTPRKPGTIWGIPTNSGEIVRAYRSSLHYATFSEQDLSGDDPITGGTDAEPSDVQVSSIPAFMSAGVNIIHPDGVDGATMAAMIWSWAENEPGPGATSVVLSAKDRGRWYGVEQKNGITNVACVSSSNRLQWKIVDHGSVCPNGFVPGAPTKAIENDALWQALKSSKGNDATVQLAVDLTSFPLLDANDVAIFNDGDKHSKTKSHSTKNFWSGWNTLIIWSVVFIIVENI